MNARIKNSAMTYQAHLMIIQQKVREDAYCAYIIIEMNEYKDGELFECIRIDNRDSSWISKIFLRSDIERFTVVTLQGEKEYCSCI